jgi:hypothetical protein
MYNNPKYVSAAIEPSSGFQGHFNFNVQPLVIPNALVNIEVNVTLNP